MRRRRRKRSAAAIEVCAPRLRSGDAPVALHRCGRANELIHHKEQFEAPVHCFACRNCLFVCCWFVYLLVFGGVGVALCSCLYHWYSLPSFAYITNFHIFGINNAIVFSAKGRKHKYKYKIIGGCYEGNTHVTGACYTPGWRHPDLCHKSIFSPGQGLRTRAKRTTGKQGLRYTPRPEAPYYYPALTRTGSRS